MLLLDIVNPILSKLKRSRVSSFGESEDAVDVAEIVIDAYETILSEHDFGIKWNIIKPTSVVGNSVTLPERVQHIHKVLLSTSIGCKSDKTATPKFITNTDGVHGRQEAVVPVVWNIDELHSTGFTTNVGCREIFYKEPDDFLQCFCVDNCTTQDEVPVVGDDLPTYWTELGGKMVLNNYCSSNTSAVSPETIRLVTEDIPVLRVDNTEDISLPTGFMQYLKAEALVVAFAVIKGENLNKLQNTAERMRKALLRSEGLGRKTRTRITRTSLPSGRPN